MNDVYCNRCGWTFYPIYQSEVNISERHLLILRGIWNTVSKINQENKWKSTSALSLQIENLQKENARLLSENKQYEQQLKKSKIYQEDKKELKRKLQVHEIANVVLPYCSYRGSIFASDKLSKIGFQANKCIEYLNSNYGISIDNYEITKCKTYGDLKSLIATKAGLLL